MHDQVPARRRQAIKPQGVVRRFKTLQRLVHVFHKSADALGVEGLLGSLGVVRASAGDEFHQVAALVVPSEGPWSARNPTSSRWSNSA